MKKSPTENIESSEKLKLLERIRDKAAKNLSNAIYLLKMSDKPEDLGQSVEDFLIKEAKEFPLEWEQNQGNIDPRLYLGMLSKMTPEEIADLLKECINIMLPMSYASLQMNLLRDNDKRDLKDVISENPDLAKERLIQFQFQGQIFFLTVFNAEPA